MRSHLLVTESPTLQFKVRRNTAQTKIHVPSKVFFSNQAARDDIMMS